MVSRTLEISAVVTNLTTEMLFYAQALSEHLAIEGWRQTETLKSGADEMTMALPLDPLLGQGEGQGRIQIRARGGETGKLWDIKRKVASRVMLHYGELCLAEEGKGYALYESMINNASLQTLVQDELRRANARVNTAEFLKEIINELDQMTFLNRVNRRLTSCSIVQIRKSGIASKIRLTN